MRENKTYQQRMTFAMRLFIFLWFGILITGTVLSRGDTETSTSIAMWVFSIVAFGIVCVGRMRTKIILSENYVTYQRVFHSTDIPYYDIDFIQELKVRSSSDSGYRHVYYFELRDVSGNRLIKIPYRLIGSRMIHREFVNELRDRNNNIAFSEEIARIAGDYVDTEESMKDLIYGLKDMFTGHIRKGK